MYVKGKCVCVELAIPTTKRLQSSANMCLEADMDTLSTVHLYMHVNMCLSPRTATLAGLELTCDDWMGAGLAGGCFAVRCSGISLCPATTTIIIIIIIKKSQPEVTTGHR